MNFDKKNVSSLQRVATPRTDVHQLSPDDFETKGELSDVCAQIVLEFLYWQELDDQIFYGQCAFWEGQAPSGVALVA